MEGFRQSLEKETILLDYPVQPTRNQIQDKKMVKKGKVMYKLYDKFLIVTRYSGLKI